MPGRIALTDPSETAFISEVFHSLSQPLTALHCTLDLALQEDETLEQLRISVETALENAERLRQRLLLVRALNDAGAPHPALATTDLSALLRQLREEMYPLFECAGREFELDLRCSPLPVRADEARLTRALFVFIDYLYRYLPEAGRLTISVDNAADSRAEIRIVSASSLPVSPAESGATHQACEIELLRRTAIAAGGEFALIDPTPGRNLWRVRLPLA